MNCKTTSPNSGSRFIDFGMELVVDLFAGGGGASHGISRAYREPDVAVNHNPVAISVHTANHSNTEHYIEDVFDVDPLVATKDRPVGLLWASPDCKHFSKAKGGQPRDKKIRGLAWVVIKWAEQARPRVICLENVEEFLTWGPLTGDGKPCPARKGETFRAWKQELEALGYVVDHRELVAADYGAPTIRKRLYIIARRDGRPIVWPEATHNKENWIGADTCIDWTIPSTSIFDRAKPLSANTLNRIVKGMSRYVLNGRPYVVSSNGCETMRAGVMMQIGYGDSEGRRVQPLTNTLPTVVASNKHALVTAFMEQANGGFYDGNGRSLQQPMSTITASGSNQRLVTAYMVKYYGNERDGVSMTAPMHTVTTKDRIGLVEVTLSNEIADKAERVADLLKEYGAAIPSEAVAVCVGDYVIVDIALRMLSPRELARAQGFPDSYEIATGITQDGKRVHVTKAAQVALIGNSVCPDVAEAIVRANLSDLISLYMYQRAAA